MSYNQTIHDWKRIGLIHDDYNALYQTYIATTHCNHCKKEFKDSRDRNMDHDHTTGLFRKIVCHKCNCRDSYINHPEGLDSKAYKPIYSKKYYQDHKEELSKQKSQYYQEHKEEIKQKQKQPYTCGCGVILCIGHKARHEKTMKHMDWWINSLD